MPARIVIGAAALSLVLVAQTARAQCPPSCTVTGGATVDNGVLYIPYGDIFGGPGAVGGVLAMAVPVP